jgi:hypothetical protein
MKRYQFVWWGWSQMAFGCDRYTGSLSAVYHWCLNLGPLEIRKRKARP